jgi:amino acid transporter
MASMAPTSGGQYHWVSEFAPERAQKFLSYLTGTSLWSPFFRRDEANRLTGWVCVLGWQSNITSVAFIAAQQIQSLMVIFESNYVFERWQGTLLIIAIGFLSIIFNSYLAKRLPLVENIILVLHITGFFAIFIPLWAMAPRNSAKMVFTQFTDGGNWGSIGLSCLVGMLGPVFTFIGPDSAAHMAEEIKDASYVLPRAMMWTAAINGTLGFAMLVTFCFCLGNIEDILANPDIMPFVQVFFNATKSEAGTAVLMTVFIILTICGCISQLASASRQMFAFARDNGLPFSKFLARVSSSSQHLT